MSHRAMWPLLVALMLVSAACSDDEPVELPGIPDDETEQAAEDSGPTSTTSTSTTTPEAATTTTSSTLAPDALVVAEQFPGVTFPAAELPTEAGSINNNRAPAETEKERALIAAFVAWVNASMEANTSVPASFTPLEGLPTTEERATSLREGYAAAEARGETLDVSGGLTVRPYVVEQEDPNMGLVYDCSINASIWRAEDGTQLDARSGWPQVGPPGVELGFGYSFELVDDVWVLTSVFSEPGACA